MKNASESCNRAKPREAVSNLKICEDRGVLPANRGVAKPGPLKGLPTIVRKMQAGRPTSQ